MVPIVAPVAGFSAYSVPLGQSTDHSAPPAMIGGPALLVDGPDHPSETERCTVSTLICLMCSWHGT